MAGPDCRLQHLCFGLWPVFDDSIWVLAQINRDVAGDGALGTSRISGMVAYRTYCWRQYHHKRRHWSWFDPEVPSIGKTTFTMPLLLGGNITPVAASPAFHREVEPPTQGGPTSILALACYCTMSNITSASQSTSTLPRIVSQKVI